MAKEYVIDNLELMQEWNWDKNNELGFYPDKITYGSAKKAWWKCTRGHEWKSSLNNRSKGTKCPYCYGRYAIKGETDLATINPKLGNEWDHEKNGDLKPDHVTVHSDRKAWWKCNKGHEWQARIDHRNKGVGCPICMSERHTSFPEYALLYYLKKYGLDVIHSYKAKGYELDIYIPSKKIAVEYDGGYWHRNREEKDLEKNIKCKEDGIKLYRIREGLAPLNSSSVDYVVKNARKDLCGIIKNFLHEIIGEKIDIDIERDTIEIENLREYTEKNNSLLFLNPILSKEWNYSKNGKLTPEHVATSSSKNIWWKCKKGHEWRATINDRNRGNGCPYCSGFYVIKGETDLKTINPKLAGEWNYKKNGALKPERVTVKSGKKVWWKCKKGHEWEATIASRANGNGCPYCSGLYAINGETDLKTINPKLADEWDDEKNGDLKPENFTANSGQKVWWKCSKGHEWQASIDSRNKGKGCPICLNKKILKGYNDLATLNPKLASEWNCDKNSNLRPEDFALGSHYKAWWKCSKGHEWTTTIKSRNSGMGCPYCSGRYAIKGENDLQTVNPTLAKEWDFEKNNGLTPADVKVNSNYKVWWRCQKGHEWQAIVASRNRGNGCPYCAWEKRKKK